MALLRKLLLASLLIVLVLAAAIFAYTNPEPIDIDVGLTRFEGVPVAIAFAALFALGWLAGLLSVSLTVWRLGRERRRLRADLLHAQTELDGLRSQLATPDAD